MERVVIRRMEPDEAPHLRDLFYRSKAYWGYDEAFMQALRAEMGIQPEEIISGWVYGLVDHTGRTLGYYHLLLREDHLHLEDLFIEPDCIGKGYGRRLFDHAVETARALGYSSFTFESDPNAEGFYLQLGAIRTGEHESIIPGRFIPHMVYNFPP